MSAETLQEIKQSLEEKPSPKVSGKPERKVDLATALLAMPEVVEKLGLLLEERKREVDALQVISGIDLNVQQALAQAQDNLKRTGVLQAQVQRRLDSLDVLEAKWNKLIERVGSVIGELERVLKQM